jgi:hypothetical protein
MILAALTALAIVVQDQSALRSAPRESAQAQAMLGAGEPLEVRGERQDYLQVYDHRLERGGYIRSTQLRTTGVQPEEAPELMAVLRFLRDQPGAESLGIAYAAAYLKAAPAEAIGAEPFDALGAMADRLAARASSSKANADDAKLAAQLDVVAGYGIEWNSFEREGRMQLCYEGDAFRRVLALQSTAEQRARAALGLTRHECVKPDLPPPERQALDQWRAEVLDRVDTTNLIPALKNRIHVRRAGVWSALAFEHSRRGEPAADTALRAIQELAAVIPGELAEPDAAAYSEAAVRVGASRWAAAPIGKPDTGLAVTVVPGQPGESCVLLTDAKHDAGNPLLRRCTYGTVWTASFSVNADHSAAALAVQPLDTWRELWVMKRQGNAANGGWTVEVLPPAAADPGIGYIECAGWVPGGQRMLVAREAHVDGGWKRRFEVVRLDTLVSERQADRPDSLSMFYRWQSASWKRETVSLR